VGTNPENTNVVCRKRCNYDNVGSQIDTLLWSNLD
jgi:hypothetical protein